VVGEVVDLAHALDRAGALPEALRLAVTDLAGLAERRWDEPDHGIWEIRGAPRRYTQSRVMAWTGLRRAAALARRGSVGGDAERWEGVAATVRAAVLDGLPPAAPLPLHPGGGLDGALGLVPLVGFLPATDRRTAATLDALSRELGASGLVERHSPIDDGIVDPCAPFVFATLWLGAALERGGGDGLRHVAAALAEHGVGGLLGEVALPGRGPLGNYPQVQSHASLILAALPRR
jgi:GH15 family glucan-1,4-alpha-glucosidase